MFETFDFTDMSINVTGVSHVFCEASRRHDCQQTEQGNVSHCSCKLLLVLSLTLIGCTYISYIIYEMILAVLYPLNIEHLECFVFLKSNAIGTELIYTYI